MTDPGPILGDTSSQDAAVPSLEGFQFLINRFLFKDFGCIIVFNVNDSIACQRFLELLRTVRARLRCDGL